MLVIDIVIETEQQLKKKWLWNFLEHKHLHNWRVGQPSQSEEEGKNKIIAASSVLHEIERELDEVLLETCNIRRLQL